MTVPVATVARLAATARQRRSAFEAALAAEDSAGPMHRLSGQMAQLCPGADFADVCAQTLVYDDLVRPAEGDLAAVCRQALRLLPAHQRGLDRPSARPPPAYDEFLAGYDPARRAGAGVVYTPGPVVEHMVRTVDEVLRRRFGLPEGVADPSTWRQVGEQLGVAVPPHVDPGAPFVSVVDPAAGTGTFLVEWVRQARRSCAGGDWPDRLRRVVVPSLGGVELMPVPAMVARSQLGAELADHGAPGSTVAVTVADTLTGPAPVGGDRALTVVIGNPPYDRLARAAAGGMVTNADPDGRSLLDDVLGPAAEDTVFSHHASLYNLYVYFWRWALAQVFESQAATGGVGVVSLVTASSWLAGPGFVGLRQLVRRLADEIWVVDLGGDNKGARPEENVFDIASPVAVVTVAAYGAGSHSVPATVHYQRVSGSRADKFSRLARLQPVGSDVPVGGATAPAPQRGRARWRAPLVVPAAGGDWRTYPAVCDLFPWQQPGCKFGRTWPVSPDPDVLLARWAALVETTDLEERARRFATTVHGRNITTRVGGRDRLCDLPPGAPPPPVVPYAYRSFDRQWALADPRLARTESPSLWATWDAGQIYLVTKPTMRLGSGPAAVVATAVPDLDSFRGSFGGKDVIPLYRDGRAVPNVAPAALEVISGAHAAGDRCAPAVTAGGLFAYTYALLAGADYTRRFVAELEIPGPRLPVSADPALFAEVVGFGEWLIHLHTGGARFPLAGQVVGPPGLPFSERGSSSRPDPRGAGSAGWDARPTRLPQGPGDIAHDPRAGRLRVADGMVSGVPSPVWAFAVSGMGVVRKWLGYRSAGGAGRSARSRSPLDGIRTDRWLPAWSEELLDLLAVVEETVAAIPRGTELLAAACAGPRVPARAFPEVDRAARRPPGGHGR